MPNPEQPSPAPDAETSRDRLARLAREAAERQAATTEAATTYFDGVAAAAEAKLEQIAKAVSELPPQDREGLDRAGLWPEEQ